MIERADERAAVVVLRSDIGRVEEEQRRRPAPAPEELLPGQASNPYAGQALVDGLEQRLELTDNKSGGLRRRDPEGPAGDLPAKASR